MIFLASSAAVTELLTGIKQFILKLKKQQGRRRKDWQTFGPPG
jgi:hypothetical protein